MEDTDNLKVYNNKNISTGGAISCYGQLTTFGNLRVDGSADFNLGRTTFRQAGVLVEAIINELPGLGGGTTVTIQNGGSWQLGYAVSSARYKTDIRDLEENNPVFRLRPRRFTWDPEKITNGAETNAAYPQGCVGLIAEEVEAECPEAALLNAAGEVSSWDDKTLITYLVAGLQSVNDRVTRLENG